jgi:HD-GYP domain-containing protein (c-di-GMP phosphodiesterase class II)
MGEQKESENWEETLDRELAMLVDQGHSTPNTTTDAPMTDLSFADPESSQDDQFISVERLRAEVFEAVRQGRALTLDIYDETGGLLLPAGSRITKRFLGRLRERGVKRVRIRSAPLRRPARPVEAPRDDGRRGDLHTPISRALDERLAGELSKPVVYHPIRGWRRPRLPIDDLKGQATQGVEKHAATSAVVAELCEALEPGRSKPMHEVQRSVSQFVDMAAVDFDLLPLIVAMQRPGEEYLFDHCVNVSLVSMAIATHLGLDRDRIVEIGLGGLLQDIGMLRVPSSIRQSPKELNEREWHEIHRHPLHTLDMLADLRGLPQSARFIGYQAHERFDGSGYPRHRSGKQLHEYAKIVSIADMYTAMTTDRPFRPALSPYLAARAVLMEGAAGRFDRALVRAFLDAVSLFPIGSQVRLSDKSKARVLRANPGSHTSPVVEGLAEDGSPTGELMDLSEEGAPDVIKAI